MTAAGWGIDEAQWEIVRLLATEALYSRRDMIDMRRNESRETTELHLTDRLVLSLGRQGRDLVRTAKVPGR